MAPLLAIEAKKRQGTRTDLTSAPKDAKVKVGRTREVVAKLVGVSPQSAQRDFDNVKWTHQTGL
jgi:hypothetical protein